MGYYKYRIYKGLNTSEIVIDRNPHINWHVDMKIQYNVQSLYLHTTWSYSINEEIFTTLL